MIKLEINKNTIKTILSASILSCALSVPAIMLVDFCSEKEYEAAVQSNQEEFSKRDSFEMIPSSALGMIGVKDEGIADYISNHPWVVVQVNDLYVSMYGGTVCVENNFATKTIVKNGEVYELSVEPAYKVTSDGHIVSCAEEGVLNLSSKNVETISCEEYLKTLKSGKQKIK